MVGSSGDDIPTQLAALLGKEAMQIRKTNECPPRISIIDVAGAITGHNADYSAQAVRNVCDQYPEVSEKITDLKFKGRSQQLTPVTDAKDIIEIITLLPGNAAARVQRQAAELLCRYLGGDLSLRKRVALLAKLSNWAGSCLKHRAASRRAARCLG